MTTENTNSRITSTAGMEYFQRRKANEHNLLLLKAGDRVVVQNSWGRNIAEVERITATQIIVNRNRFNRETGEEIGKSGSRRSLSTFVEEFAVAATATKRHNEALRITEQTSFKHLSVETLEAINALVAVEKAARLAEQRATTCKHEFGSEGICRWCKAQKELVA